MKFGRWVRTNLVPLHKTEKGIPILGFLLGVMGSLLRPLEGNAVFLLGPDKWLSGSLWMFLLWSMADSLLLLVLGWSLWGVGLVPALCVLSGYLRTDLLQLVLRGQTSHFYGGIVSYLFSAFCLLWLSALTMSVSVMLWKRKTPDRDFRKVVFAWLLFLFIETAGQSIFYYLLR